MPYNTGDFTQQGIAGYVNGGLLLNNKRDVTARVSTDEESAGIDSVDIKIKDRLNNIEYHITGENLSEGENVIGGGGGVNNPIIHLNFGNIANDNDFYLSAPLLHENNINYSQSAMTDILEIFGENGVDMYTNYYISQDVEYGIMIFTIQPYGSIIAQSGFTPDVSFIHVTDMVNCTADGSIIAITDPTQNASCTIAYYNPK